MSPEYLFLSNHSLKTLCKSKLFPRRYIRKREWLFSSEHSVDLYSAYNQSFNSYQTKLQT